MDRNASSLNVALSLYWLMVGRIYQAISQRTKSLVHLIVAPGVIVHELSHLTVAVLTVRKIHSIALYRFNHASGELGHVTYSHSSTTPFTWLIDAIIAMAPLAGGLVAMAISSVMLLPTALIGDIQQGLNYVVYNPSVGAVSWFYGHLFDVFSHQISLSMNWILWLYTVVSLSLGAVPSIQDIRNSLSGGLLVAAILSVIIISQNPFLITLLEPFSNLAVIVSLCITLIALPIMMAFLGLMISKVFSLTVQVINSFC